MHNLFKIQQWSEFQKEISILGAIHPLLFYGLETFNDPRNPHASFSQFAPCFSWVSCWQITDENYLNHVSNAYSISNISLWGIEINITEFQITFDECKHFGAQYLTNFTFFKDLWISISGLGEVGKNTEISVGNLRILCNLLLTLWYHVNMVHSGRNVTKCI